MEYDLEKFLDHPLMLDDLLPSALIIFGALEVEEYSLDVRWRLSVEDEEHQETLTIRWKLSTLEKRIPNLTAKLQNMQARDRDRQRQIEYAAVAVAAAVLANLEKDTQITERCETGTGHDYYLNETDDEMIEIAGRGSSKDGLGRVFLTKTAQSESNVTFRDPIYGKLARDSSQGMLKFDGEIVQGNYDEAALAIWRAGLQRLEMSRYSQQHQDICRAIGDALSASSCFIVAGNEQWAKLAMARVESMEPFPADQLYLHNAWAARKKEYRKMLRQQKKFRKTINEHPEWLKAPSAEAIEYVKEEIQHDLPGWPRVLSLLACLETAQGLFADAAKHATLAAEFALDEPQLVCRALLARARVEPVGQVLAWSQTQLERYPQSRDLPLVRAYLQTIQAQTTEDYRSAVQTLQPLAHADGLSAAQHAIVLALQAYLADQIGDPVLHEEARRNLERLPALQPTDEMPASVAEELQAMVHGVLTVSSPERNGSNRNGSLAHSLFHVIEKSLASGWAA